MNANRRGFLGGIAAVLGSLAFWRAQPATAIAIDPCYTRPLLEMNGGRRLHEPQPAPPTRWVTTCAIVADQFEFHSFLLPLTDETIYVARCSPQHPWRHWFWQGSLDPDGKGPPHAKLGHRIDELYDVDPEELLSYGVPRGLRRALGTNV